MYFQDQAKNQTTSLKYHEVHPSDVGLSLLCWRTVDNNRLQI